MGKRKPLPSSTAVGPAKELDAALHLRTVSTGVPNPYRADAENMLAWYRELAAALRRGGRVPVGWTPEHAAVVARQIEMHCATLWSQTERVNDFLAEVPDPSPEQLRILTDEAAVEGLRSGLALGALGARIGADPFVNQGKRSSKGGRKRVLHRWGPTAQTREDRNARWRDWDKLLRLAEPRASERRRCRVIAGHAKEWPDEGASISNVRSVLRGSG